MSEFSESFFGIFDSYDPQKDYIADYFSSNPEGIEGFDKIH